MNILFLTMSSGFQNIETSGIYTDLMRTFRDKGHDVYIVFPVERRLGLPTQLKSAGRVHTLGVKTLNVTKTNVVEKGVGQLLIEILFNNALKKYFKNIKFDVILYSTPPITFTKVIQYAKKQNPTAMAYLLLKDIFPQNAVDIGMMTKTGVKGLLYKFFRKKEKDLYNVSDYIGCMSPANVRYLLKHNPTINQATVEVAPNSYNIPTASVEKSAFQIEQIRTRYNLPTDRPIFLYGGNMGRPQGIPFLIECMNAVKDREDCHFLIVGNGTEYAKLEAFVKENNPRAVSLFKSLPKADYDRLAAACDVGLIFLDYRFTIPNYPSRLLPYLMERKPIIAVTDTNCDTGTIAEKNGYGFYSPSNSVETFVQVVEKMLAANMQEMGENGYKFYLNNYTTEHTYNTIMKHLNQ